MSPREHLMPSCNGCRKNSRWRSMNLPSRKAWKKWVFSHLERHRRISRNSWQLTSSAGRKWPTRTTSRWTSPSSRAGYVQRTAVLQAAANIGQAATCPIGVSGWKQQRIGKLKMSEHVEICEVGPRDGLQMIKDVVPTETKLKWINQLLDAGLPEVEAGSFVPPKLVPQMADTDTVIRRLLSAGRSGVAALVPNLKGAQIAYEAGAEVVIIPVSVSD